MASCKKNRKKQVTKSKPRFIPKTVSSLGHVVEHGSSSGMGAGCVSLPNLSSASPKVELVPVTFGSTLLRIENVGDPLLQPIATPIVLPFGETRSF